MRGSLAPEANLTVVNTAKAGSAILPKFSPGGNQGLNMLAGSPTALLDRDVCSFGHFSHTDLAPHQGLQGWTVSRRQPPGPRGGLSDKRRHGGRDHASVCHSCGKLAGKGDRLPNA
ncbi:hypothetical protein GCM10008949_39650 [Deinococcus humi]|nr:hypothetical protein GCM10008949_39650 [Deinococcus humi]